MSMFELKTDNSTAFLDVQILRPDNCLKFKVFRKATHSNSYLHFFSFHPQSVKLSIAQGLFLRAYRVCSPEHLSTEIDFIFSSLIKLAYPDFFLKKALMKARSTFFHPTTRQKFQGSTFCLPFVPSLDSPFHSKLSSSLNCKLVFNYPNKLKSQLTSNRPVSDTSSGVYRINCIDCNKFYIGETGRSLPTRIREHKNDFKKHNLNNAMYVHSVENNHSFNFKDPQLVVPCNDLHTRKVVESSLIRHHENQVVNLNLGLNFIDPFVRIGKKLITSRQTNH